MKFTNWKLQVLLVFPFFSLDSSAQTSCSEALVKDTYISQKSELRDWRLAQFVSRQQWDEAKRNGTANAIIYGVPVGETYEEFQNALQVQTNAVNESLTTDQRDNILWTGIADGSLYLACLNSQVYSQRGLHAAVVSAQRSDITVRIKWDLSPSNIELTWPVGIDAALRRKLPKKIHRGETSFVLPRPEKQYTLVGNYKGMTTEPIVVTPLPSPPSVFDPCRGTRTETGMTVLIRHSSMCRQRVAWNAYGSFTKGCDSPSEGAIVQIVDANGRRTVSTWSASSFGNAYYTGLSGAAELERGQDAQVMLVRTDSSCSNPTGPIGMKVEITKLGT